MEAACSHTDAAGGHDDLKVNTLDPSFRMDKGPLVPKCTCFTSGPLTLLCAKCQPISI